VRKGAERGRGAAVGRRSCRRLSVRSCRFGLVGSVGCDLRDEFRECCICYFRLNLASLNYRYSLRMRFSGGLALFPECSRKRPFRAIPCPQTCVDVSRWSFAFLCGRKHGLKGCVCSRISRILLRGVIFGIGK